MRTGFVGSDIFFLPLSFQPKSANHIRVPYCPALCRVPKWQLLAAFMVHGWTVMQGVGYCILGASERAGTVTGQCRKQS